MLIWRITLFFIAAWFSLSGFGLAEEVYAFPNAEGFDSKTPGGRGGQVFLVTHLDDYPPGKEKPIPGNLRAALSAKGPRMVVFRVSGTIPLKAALKVT